MGRSLVALVAVAAAGLTFAPPAAAGEAEYLQHLRERLPFLSEGQLLAAGQKVCAATNSGVGSSDIVGMIRRDLDKSGVTVASATDITTTAIIQLGC